MPPAGFALPGLEIRRIHRPDLTSYFSNLGPGVFTNFDLTLDCRHSYGSRHEVIFLEDPSSSRTIEFELSNGVYEVVNPKRAMRSLQFFDAANQPVTNFDYATTAVATRHDGWTYHFAIHNARFGRLTALRNRNGQGTSLTYLYP